MARYLAGAEADIPVGEKRLVKAGVKTVVLYHLPDGFYATQRNCTHAFGPLERGTIIDDAHIQCPWHHSQFDIRTGEVVRWANFPPGIQVLSIVRHEKALTCYPVTVEDGKVYVEL
jgi:3-phenylpropionate/trans-cinnamate dioxygenase ferredoxin component